MYKTLGFKLLLEVFCPASAFATADSDEARNPQRFIHVTVVRHTRIANRTNSTFGFCRHAKPMLKKPKELFLANAQFKIR